MTPLNCVVLVPVMVLPRELAVVRSPTIKRASLGPEVGALKLYVPLPLIEIPL